jgi:hypothetical protein
MAISTYTDLKAAIADFIARSDLTAVIPTFVTLAEARLSRAVRALEMQASSTSTLSSGARTIPADYQEHISARWVGTRTQDLAYVEPDSPEWRFRYRPNGDPQMYTIMAGNLEVRPSAAGDVKLYYYKTLTSEALSDSNADNWLLTKCPDMYLYTSIAEYHLYMKDDARAAQFLVLAKAEGDKESLATDTSKFMLNPSRPVDTGNQGSRNPNNMPIAAGGRVA